MTNNKNGLDPGSDSNDLTVWFEILDPIRARTYDDARVRDDYGNIYFVGTGKSRAHAGRMGTRPDCIPEGVRAYWAHDLWNGPVHPPRCAVCLVKHPVTQVIE